MALITSTIETILDTESSHDFGRYLIEATRKRE
jgi:hypothetical protein